MTSISVIIPTWNRSGTLLKAINSALNQTYPIAEVMVCDDGSTDDSKILIEALNDARVKWIDCGRNGRPAIPRNIGAKASKGKWLAFLDSDDEWPPEKIALQMQTLEKDKLLLAVCSNANKISSSTTTQAVFHSINQVRFTFTDLAATNYIICSSAMVHRSVFEKAGGFPEHECFKAIEDYCLWLKIATFTDWSYIKQPLLKYADNPAESIRATDIDVWQQRKIIFSMLRDWLPNQHLKTQKPYLRIAKKELLLARYRTSKNSIIKIVYRLRYAFNI